MTNTEIAITEISTAFRGLSVALDQALAGTTIELEALKQRLDAKESSDISEESLAAILANLSQDKGGE